MFDVYLAWCRKSWVFLGILRHQCGRHCWSCCTSSQSKTNSLTVLFLRQASLYKFGAMSLGARLFSQLHYQNFAVLPSPMVTEVLALKNCSSIIVHQSNHKEYQFSTHGLSFSVQSYHSNTQLQRSSIFSSSRSSCTTCSRSSPACFLLFVFLPQHHQLTDWLSHGHCLFPVPL